MADVAAVSHEHETNEPHTLTHAASAAAAADGHDRDAYAADDGTDATFLQCRSAFTVELLELMTKCAVTNNIDGYTPSAREKRIDLLERVVRMIEKNSKRPVEQSLIDLSQTMPLPASYHCHGYCQIGFLVSLVLCFVDVRLSPLKLVTA